MIPRANFESLKRIARKLRAAVVTRRKFLAGHPRVHWAAAYVVRAEAAPIRTAATAHPNCVAHRFALVSAVAVVLTWWSWTLAIVKPNVRHHSLDWLARIEPTIPKCPVRAQADADEIPTDLLIPNI